MSAKRSKGNAEQPRTLPVGILDAMREPAAILDANLRILKAGRVFCRFWNRSREETEGQWLNDLVMGQIAASKMKELFAPLLESDAGPDHETAAVEFALSGSLQVAVSARRIRPEGDSPLLILLTIADVTDNDRTGAIQGNEEKRFRILADAAFEGLAFTRGGVFVDLNDRLARMLGYRREELIGSPVVNYVAVEDRARVAEFMAEGRLEPYEHQAMRKDGTVFHVEIRVRTSLIDDRETRIAAIRDITENKRAEEKLLRFQFSIDRASDAIFWMGREGDFLYVNDQACRSLGYSREELMGLRLWDIDPHFPKDRWKIQWQEMSVAGNRIFETIHRRKDGTDFPVEVSSNHILFGDGEHHHVAFVRDISYRKQAEAEQSKLEAQLYQAQKMESIGRLAGGVAHDFNNMLGVILGYADLMKADLATDHPLLKKVLEIEKAANHSRDITTQLLAFSRKQVVSPQMLDLNARIGDLQKTLARLIGEDIDLQVFTGDGLWTVKFDPTQIEQILINLAVNARDAMPAGGKLTIETENTHLDEAYCREHVGFVPGDFARLSVSDNGSGMEPETLSHIFEPFFTTKEVGKGTGLGLATVYGIVKQGGGFINAYSEPGQGTTFTIYLPRIADKGGVVTASDDGPLTTGTETVLLVEDDEMVRVMTRAMLERIGYTVHAVSTPEAALAFFEAGGTVVDLLMTDVVMPVMNGKELRDRIAAIRPVIKTLFMSGYTANVIVQQGVLDEGVHFIQKPFSMNHLARMVRKALS